MPAEERLHGFTQGVNVRAVSGVMTIFLPCRRQLRQQSRLEIQSQARQTVQSAG
jgi:hypothetical protein